MVQKFGTKHEAAVWKNKGISEGFYKDCIHLKVIGNPLGAYVHCEEESFGLGKPGMGPACPENCVVFVDRLQTEKAERRRKRWEMFWNRLGWLPRYFKELPAPTQVALIILAIVVFSRRIAETVLAIAKALK